MWIALTAKNKSGFVDGSTKEPKAGTDLYRAWSRSNNMVISWLLNSLSKDISESVLYYSTAKTSGQNWKTGLARVLGLDSFNFKRISVTLSKGHLILLLIIPKSNDSG